MPLIPPLDSKQLFEKLKTLHTHLYPSGEPVSEDMKGFYPPLTPKPPRRHGNNLSVHHQMNEDVITQTHTRAHTMRYHSALRREILPL